MSTLGVPTANPFDVKTGLRAQINNAVVYFEINNLKVAVSTQSTDTPSLARDTP